jgi:hypothetical protein
MKKSEDTHAFLEGKKTMEKKAQKQKDFVVRKYFFFR